MTSLHFRGRGSLLQTMDPRIKIPLFLLIQTIATNPPWLILAVCFGLLVLLALAAKATILEVLAPIPNLYFLFGLIIAFHVWPPAVSDPIWRLNLAESLRYCLQLIFVIGTAQTMLLSTRINDLRLSFIWYLRPLPIRSRYMISLAVALIFRFVALLLDFATERREAAINRGYGRSGRGLLAHCRHIRLQTVGLIQVGFDYARELEAALQARYLDRLPPADSQIIRGYTNPDSRRPAQIVQAIAALGVIILLTLSRKFWG